MYTDTHAHYDDARFNDDRDSLLLTLHENGADKIINAASDMEASRFGIKLSEKYPFIYAAVGVHPHEVQNMTESDVNEIKKLASHKKVVAIGEIGLDFYYENSDRDKQRIWFVSQLKLALELKKPVIIHSRNATAEIYETLRNYDGGANGGVIHCFSSGIEMAEKFIALGFHIGIGGVVTFKNAKKLVEVAEKIPLDKMLLETDCPYLSPEPNRGKRNESSNIKYIAEKIAQIRGIPVSEVLNVTNCNSVDLFAM
ncbi:MAG: TatD family hydrolase [Clostridiales bacterium]|jgi:TatD DNase family protein|nr:TatD family hydrolase [Clostridiales bacterium]